MESIPKSERTTKRISPEQIGFLGICGTTYPVNLGPNNIGGNPQLCNIVLNEVSVSSVHAVINVLNETKYMIMDLGSEGMTKLNVNILQPFIPHELKNGDIVQFGDVFGIFRILEEESDLPMTPIVIPDTPVFNRVKKTELNNPPVPESPTIIERDDSFDVPPQPNPKEHFTILTNYYIKPSAKTTDKIDNIYGNSSKKSILFISSDNFNDSADCGDNLLENKLEPFKKPQIDFVDLTTKSTENCSTVPLQSKQDYSEEFVKISPSKIPLQSPMRIKRKEIPKLATPVSTSPRLSKMIISACNEDEAVCTQNAPQIINILSEEMENNNGQTLDDELIPCSAEDLQTKIRFPHIENCASPKKIIVVDDNSCKNSDDMPSDISISDLDETPKKLNPLKIMDVELPSNQEIKRFFKPGSSRVKTRVCKATNKIQQSFEENKIELSVSNKNIRSTGNSGK